MIPSSTGVTLILCSWFWLFSTELLSLFPTLPEETTVFCLIDWPWDLSLMKQEFGLCLIFFLKKNLKQIQLKYAYMRGGACNVY